MLVGAAAAQEDEAPAGPPAASRTRWTSARESWSPQDVSLGARPVTGSLCMQSERTILGYGMATTSHSPTRAAADAPGASRLARDAARARRAGQGARRSARGGPRTPAQLLRGAHVPRRRRGRAHAHVRPRLLDPAQPQRPDAARRPVAARGAVGARRVQRRRPRPVRQAHARRAREPACRPRDAPRRRAGDVPRPVHARGARGAGGFRDRVLDATGWGCCK